MESGVLDMLGQRITTKRCPQVCSHLKHDLFKLHVYVSMCECRYHRCEKEDVRSGAGVKAVMSCLAGVRDGRL